MSVYKKMFDQVLKQKFGSGYTSSEWYIPNTDSINYTVTYNNQQCEIKIDGVSRIVNSGKLIQVVMRQLLNEAFS